MDRTKGLIEMVEAVGLPRSGVKMSSSPDLVGWPERNDAVLEEIGLLATKADISEKIVYQGPKSFGSDRSGRMWVRISL